MCFTISWNGENVIWANTKTHPRNTRTTDGGNRKSRKRHRHFNCSECSWELNAEMKLFTRYSMSLAFVRRIAVANVFCWPRALPSQISFMCAWESKRQLKSSKTCLHRCSIKWKTGIVFGVDQKIYCHHCWCTSKMQRNGRKTIVFRAWSERGCVRLCE